MAALNQPDKNQAAADSVKVNWLQLSVSQLTNPLFLLLLAGAIVSLTISDILVASVLLGLAIFTALTQPNSAAPNGPNILKKQLDKIYRLTSWLAGGMSLLILLVGAIAGVETRLTLLLIIAALAATLPFGLGLTIKTHLARSQRKLVKHQISFRDASALAELGTVDIVLTDEVGQIGEDRLSVTEFMLGSKTYQTDPSGYNPNSPIWNSRGVKEKTSELRKSDMFFAACVLSAQAHINPPDFDHQNWYSQGDPVGAALTTVAMKAGASPEHLNNNFIEVGRQTSQTGSLTTSLRRFNTNRKLFLFTRGEASEIIERVSEIWDNGLVRALTDADKKRLVKSIKQSNNRSTTTLALAYRVFPASSDPQSLDLGEINQGLTWLGLLSLSDATQETADSISSASRQGFKLSLMTSGYGRALSKNADRVNFSDSSNVEVISDHELKDLDDKSLLKIIERGRVLFSCMSEQHKSRVIALATAAGHRLALASSTADGRSEIRLVTGNNYDQDSQLPDATLPTNSLSQLINVVENARHTYHKMRRAIFVNLSGNIAMALLVLASLVMAVFWQIPPILSVLEIIAISMIVVTPLLIVASRDNHAYQPKHYLPDHPKALLDKESLKNIIWSGLLIGGLTIISYLWFFAHNHISGDNLADGSTIHWEASALVFLSLALCQIGSVLQQRHVRGLFARLQFHNHRLWIATFISLFLVLNIIYNPWLTSTFHTGGIGSLDWLAAIITTAIFLFSREFVRHTEKHSPSALFKKHNLHKIRHHLDAAKV